MADEAPKQPIKPTSLITEDDVKKALLGDKGEDAQLLSWKPVDFTKQGDNFACVVSSVEAKYTLGEKTQEVSYVVKLNPCRGFPDFEHFNGFIFDKEVKFYTCLLPELNAALEEKGLEKLHFARCFHGNLESTKEQIYLEDLRPRGFKMVDRRKGMDEPHARLVLKELGRLHAASRLLEKKMQELVEVKYGFIEKDFLDAGNSDALLPLFESHIITAVSMLEKVDGYERAIAWANNLKPGLETLLRNGMKSEKFSVVNHGDCWNNNVLFRYDSDGTPVEVMLVDLQINRKASLAVDLNYFMFTSLTGDVRLKNLESFLSTYYDSFKGVMEAGELDMFFTEEELLEEYRAKNTIGGYFGMMVIPIILLESGEVPDFTGSSQEDMERIFAEMRQKAIESIEKNPITKPRFLSMFDELMATGTIP